MNNVTAISVDNDFTFITSIFLTMVGLPGNSITILILSSSKMREISMFRYLIISMVNDSLVLVTMWFSTLPNMFLADSMCCKLSLYLSNLFYNYSAWIVVLNLIDRLIIVKCPTKFRFRDQLKFQALLLLTTFMVIILATIPFYIYSDINTRINITSCGTNSPETEFYVEFSGALVGVIVPFVLMIILTTLIGNQLIKKSRNLESRKKFKKEIRLIKLMISMSLFFLIFNLPYYIQQLIHTGLSFNNRALFISNYIFNLIFNITNQLCYIYNSFGFFVCLFCNKVFRNYLYSKFSFLQNKIHPILRFSF